MTFRIVSKSGLRSPDSALRLLNVRKSGARLRLFLLNA